MSTHEITPELRDEIIRSASKAQSTSVDGTSTSRRSLFELIAADEYLQNRAAAKNPAAALKVFKIKTQD